MRHGRAPHPAMSILRADYRRGAISRREFLSLATTFAGGTLASGSGLLCARGALAQEAETAPQGRSLSIQMDVRPLTDPRLYAWSEMGNATRGLLEYLVEMDRSGRFFGGLLAGWDVNDDASVYTLHLKRDVTWNTGEAFVAEDVVANLHGWADTTVPGNSMATRLAALVDPATGRARAGAITDTDRHTVRVALSRPDATFISGLSDYPAAVQHRDRIGETPLDHGVGTGAYRIASYEPGVAATLVRDPGRTHHRAPTLDTVTFRDLGPDPSIWHEAAAAGEIDMIFRAETDDLARFADLGWTRHATPSATTVVVRPNQRAEVVGLRPYADRQVRRALALAIDNAVCLELAIAGRGSVAENHHVAPLQPDHAEVAPARHDPRAARDLLAAAGMADFEHEIVSVDDTWRRNTADVVAAQLTDAGIPNRRAIVPREDFAARWTTYPFSATNWNHRALGVEVLSLAYRSGATWNETGFADPAFDALLDEAAAVVSAEARRPVMARLQTMMQDEGVTIQPFWQTLYRYAAPHVTGAAMHPKFELDIHDLGWA